MFSYQKFLDISSKLILNIGYGSYDLLKVDLKRVIYSSGVDRQGSSGCL